MKRSAAVFTIQQDEPVFLPVWLRYYAKHYPCRDIYVLNHALPTDLDNFFGVVRAFGAVHVGVFNDESFDHRWLLETVKRFQRFLFQSYESVLFTEVDELVMPADGSSVYDYARRDDRPLVTVSGFNVIHYIDQPAIDWDKPLLAQRKYGYHAPRYSKPLLARRPTEWHIGFHGADGAGPADPSLLNVHLHRIDLGYCHDRHRRASARNWSRYDRENGLGVQYHRYDHDELTKWFYHGSDLGTGPLDIPAAIKGNV